MNKILLSVFFVPFLFLACTPKNVKDLNKNVGLASDSIYTIEYAKGFRVNVFPEYKEVIVVDPWDSTKILQNYILVDKTKELPANLPKGTLIRTPLDKVVVYSTIHSATLNEIGKIETIKGVCEPEYIDVDYIKNGVKDGLIADLGQAANPIVEKIIDVDPEAIFVSPIQGRTYGSVEKSGIPIIETPDYMEPYPLGRAEWIRFYSLFFDNEPLVDSLFNITVTNYNKIKENVAKVSYKPTVFLDLMYGNTWYTSGGNSFMSKMLSDAGASYIWKDNNFVGSRPLAFEQVLEKAENADFWLIKYNNPSKDLTYSGLKSEFRPYSYFDAFKNKNVYECNTGKINYYEDLPIHPDFILQDFAFVFHPELFPNYIPLYYRKMKD